MPTTPKPKTPKAEKEKEPKPKTPKVEEPVTPVKTPKPVTKGKEKVSRPQTQKQKSKLPFSFEISPEDFAHAHAAHAERPKSKSKKHKSSKQTEEIVNGAVKDFWDSAWNICAERFFITSAPFTVSQELRNVWLRIVEAEWLDMSMQETPAMKYNRIFQNDEPPLPLAYDSWSRGAVELLPKVRRDSVLDPFLRGTESLTSLVSAEAEANTSPSMISLGGATREKSTVNIRRTESGTTTTTVKPTTTTKVTPTTTTTKRPTTTNPTTNPRTSKPTTTTTKATTTTTAKAKPTTTKAPRTYSSQGYRYFPDIRNFPDPNDCRAYFQCVLINGRYYSYSCPSGSDRSTSRGSCVVETCPTTG